MLSRARAILCLALMSFAGCAHRTLEAPGLPPVPAEANLVVIAYEVVQNAEEDGISATQVYVDGKEAGRTESARKSVEKQWYGTYLPGNHPIRFERWLLPSVGPWAKAGDEAQPVERFFWIHPGERTIIRLKYFDQGRRYAFEVSREALVLPKSKKKK